MQDQRLGQPTVWPGPRTAWTQWGYETFSTIHSKTSGVLSFIQCSGVAGFHCAAPQGSAYCSVAELHAVRCAHTIHPHLPCFRFVRHMARPLTPGNSGLDPQKHRRYQVKRLLKEAPHHIESRSEICIAAMSMSSFRCPRGENLKTWVV